MAWPGGRWAFGLLAALLPATASPHRLTAQSLQPLQLAGRVMRLAGADSTAVSGAWVVAHVISPERQGPVDSTRSDAAGRFRFRVAEPESTAVYVVSTRYQGIGYFAEPVGGDMGDRGSPMVLAVYDTSSAGPPLILAMRHIVVAGAPATGQRRVIDIFQVENPGTATRIARDSLHPLWVARLPREARSPEPGGDVSPSAIRFAGDSMLVTAPFPPGAKQVVVTYTLPENVRELDVPVDQPTRQLDLLIEDSTAVAGGALAERPPVVIERRRFRRFSAEDVAAGARAGVRFGSPREPARALWWIAVLVAGLGIAGGAALLLRPPPPVAQPDEESLLGRLVALDERYAGREVETPATEWAAYLERRAALKRELARRVARAQPQRQIAGQS